MSKIPNNPNHVPGGQPQGVLAQVMPVPYSTPEMAKSSRGDWPDWTRENKPLRRQLRAASCFAGVGAGAFLLALWLVLPARFSFAVAADDAPPRQPLKVAYERPEPEPVVRPDFMEANPNVPENKPDPTRNFSYKDQQAAQMENDPLSDAEKPEIDGEIEESQKIVESTLSQTQGSPLPPGLPQPPKNAASGEPGVAFELPTPPAPDFIQQETPEDQEGIDSTELTPQTGDKPTDKEAERVIPLEHPGDSQAVAVVMEQVQIDGLDVPEGVPLPQARPRLQVKAPPAPLALTRGRASQMGTLAVDARFSEYGQYTQRMMEAISAQWTQLGRTFDYRTRDIGTRVQVRFLLDPEGHVSELKVIETSASRPATLLVTDAILSRAPYGKWTEQMLAELPEKQELTITFHYR